MLLRYIRNWAPLSMEPLYGGLVEILDRLGIDNKERVLFEYYADHWGVRDDKNGRLLAVRTLEALGTDASRSALREILTYVRNRVLEPGELALIQTAAGISGPAAARDTGKADRSSVAPLHPAPAG